MEGLNSVAKYFFQVAFKFVNPFVFKKLFLKFDNEETSETPCQITMRYENSNSISHIVVPHSEMVPSWYLFWIPSSYISFSLSIYPPPFSFSVFYVLRKNEAESNFSLLHTYREQYQYHQLLSAAKQKERFSRVLITFHSI